ncbi:MAG: NHL repeat-containing protein [Candidatus Cybelea sp.]
MPIPSRLEYVSSGIVALALLAGCSGGAAGVPSATTAISQQSVGAQSMSSVLRPGVPELHSNRPPTAFVSNEINAKGGASIIVSDASDNVVDIFNAKGKQTAQLTGFSEPQGLALDAAGNLYVADTSNSRIQVYAAGFKGTPTTINDPGEFPASVTIDSKGNLGVANILTTSDGPGSVSFFNNGGTLLTTLSNANFAKVIFDAFDDKGNLYIDGTNASGAFVAGEVVGGVSGKAITILATGNSVGYPGGIAISSRHKIVLDDQQNLTIFTYNAPVKGSLGMPIATTPLTGAGDPISFAFTRTNRGIWVADAARGLSSGSTASAPGEPPPKVLVSSADRYRYPKGGESSKDILFQHGAQPDGIVLSRDAQP